MLGAVFSATGCSRLSYCGHSMGATSFFVLMHEHPEMANKVEQFVALAPVTIPR